MEKFQKNWGIVIAVLAAGVFTQGNAWALPLSQMMMDTGVRHSLAIQSIPGGIKKHVFEVEHEDGCVMESANAVYLGSPEKLAGYEVVVNCSDQPYQHMAIYYDVDGSYLDTLAPGVD